ncbi:MAG TPA: flagellar hook-length control protein FliK [Telluria sp.]
MQTTILPIQTSGAALDGAQRQQQQGSGDAGKFSASLSREMALRQNAAPMPAAIAPVQKPKTADKPAAASPQQPAREAAKQVRQDDAADDGKVAKVASSDEAAPGDEPQAAEAPASTPLADMLALVASFNQLQGAAAPVPEAPLTTLPAVTGEQIAALQAGVTQLTVGADQVAPDVAALPVGEVVAGVPAAGVPAAGVPGAMQNAALAAGDKAQAQQGAEFRAAQDVASAAALAKAAPDAASLAGRQARDEVDAAAVKEAAPLAPTMLQAQPAALEMAQAATGVATDRLAARVGTPAWNQQVGQKIVWMAAGEAQTATLTLNPPDLGPMQVVLSVSNDQTTVAFSSNQLEVRQALENALPRLREMMSESGIALGNATVDAGMPDGRDGQQQAGRGEGSARRGGVGSGAGDAASGAVPAPRTRPLGERGMVDTFA